MVERSGQGVDVMFQTSLEEGKLPPDFSGSTPDAVRVVLHGTVQDEAFVTFLERLSHEKQWSFSVADLVALDAIHRGVEIPDGVQGRVADLVGVGAIERVEGSRLVLARSFYIIKGRAGAYTRRVGLDRDMRKELLLKHVATCGAAGAPLHEFSEVLPDMTREDVLLLLRELRDAGRARTEGVEEESLWFLRSRAPESA